VFLGFHQDMQELHLKVDASALGDALRAALKPAGGLMPRVAWSWCSG
jgi:hypothetical protein